MEASESETGSLKCCNIHHRQTMENIYYTLLVIIKFLFCIINKREGKKGRLRKKLMDWMMEDRYGTLKVKAQHREEWSPTFGPARRQIT